jgi:cyclopropane-fatty-acyl-phospholipid synthase
MASRIAVGSLAVTLPEGRRLAWQGAAPGPHADLVIHDPRVARRYLLGGQVAFAESYMDGDWSSPDLAAVLEFFVRNHDAVAGAYEGGWVVGVMRRLWHGLRANTRGGSRRNIAYHYDLGNAFYEQWLDPSMTYSSAVFAEPAQDLAAAQANKYRLVAEKLALAPGKQVLEIGCGWGGFATQVAREYDCRVTAITVSKAQAEFAAARVQREGLADKVAVRLVDYRDLAERFDAIASIEMFEAVGERYWPTFFAGLRDRLKPGGRASLQVITIADRFFESYRRNVDFIQRYIFPGGMLPSPGALAREIGRAGLSLVKQEFFGLHYARTLAEWNRRFQAAWPEIARMPSAMAGFDQRFKRMWEYYLAYCEAGFRAASIDVAQLALTRG